MSVAAAAGGVAGTPVAVGNGPGGCGGVGILAGGVGAAVGGGGVWYSVGGGGVGPDAAGGGLGGAAVAVLAGSAGRVVGFWNEKVGAGTAVGTGGGGGIPAVAAGNGVAVGESAAGGALDPQASITAPAMTAAVNGAAILLTFIIITA